MAKVLIVGKNSKETDGLALVMQFAGHQCAVAESMQATLTFLQHETFDLVLTDPTLDKNESEKLLKRLKTISPSMGVMVISDEMGSPLGADEAITLADSFTQNPSPRFSRIRRGEAFAHLLPDQESLGRVSGLPQTVGMWNRLAMLYHSQGDFAAAEPLYKKALKVTAKAVGKNRGEEATILNNLARLYHDESRGVEAEVMYKRSVAIVEKTFGPNHPKLARRLRNLADLYRMEGRHDEATLLFKRVKAIEKSPSK
jgi:CheY-like chemotaxis protein